MLKVMLLPGCYDMYLSVICVRKEQNIQGNRGSENSENHAFLYPADPGKSNLVDLPKSEFVSRLAFLSGRHPTRVEL